MKLGELGDLIAKVIEEKGFGGAEVTVLKGGDPTKIKTIIWCVFCTEFHIVFEGSSKLKEEI